MEMKDLNKSQLILLALLISFVTSIATGISTVTLMQQAPSSITVPINRIVRQTIEKVVPGEIKTSVQTVVIKEEDLVVDAIAKNQSAIFSLTKEATDDAGKIVEISAGRGLAVASDGTLVADAALVPDKEVYYAKNDSGKFKADFVSTDKGGFSFLKIGASLDEKNKLTFTMPSFGDINKMKAGQKLLVLDQSFTSIIFDGSKEDIKIKVSNPNSGSPVVNLDAEVVGIVLSGDTSFIPISLITGALKPADKPVEAPKIP
jgi:S1-C subfamily serine protease